MALLESRESVFRGGSTWSREVSGSGETPRLRWGAVPEPAAPATLPREPLQSFEPLEPLEPLEEADWRPAPTLRERLLRAVGTPFAIGAVLFVGAIIGAVVLVAVQPHTPEPDLAAPVVEAEIGSASVDAGVETGEEASPAPVLLVHVVGEVRSPGVVELEGGARVRDAIEAAGGATELAVLAGVNLARLLTDGEQIVVPNAETAEAAAAGAPGAGVAGAPGPVSLNAADAAALETLPGVGPALAQRILAWRAANGAFSSVEQLLEISGIGQKTFEGLRESVTL
ncbi:MAG: ComEA family DNA-binding protein [Candidatus Leucobacter sulfamidivorax]|nr:ComEA family DNA-binding protein [Candidatus Leucobacter sulfamidivorax]